MYVCMYVEKMNDAECVNSCDIHWWSPPKQKATANYMPITMRRTPGALAAAEV